MWDAKFDDVKMRSLLVSLWKKIIESAIFVILDHWKRTVADFEPSINVFVASSAAPAGAKYDLFWLCANYPVDPFNSPTNVLGNSCYCIRGNDVITKNVV